MIRCAPFAGTTLDTSDLLTRHNYSPALWRTRIERIFADWVGEMDVPIYRRREMTGFTQNDIGVDIELSDDVSMREEYLLIRPAGYVAWVGDRTQQGLEMP